MVTTPMRRTSSGVALLAVLPLVVAALASGSSEVVLARAARASGRQRWGLIATTSPYPEQRVQFRPGARSVEALAFAAPGIAAVLALVVVSMFAIRRLRAEGANRGAVVVYVLSLVGSVVALWWSLSWKFLEAIGIFI
jgi:hypothetical protein